MMDLVYICYANLDIPSESKSFFVRETDIEKASTYQILERLSLEYNEIGAIRKCNLVKGCNSISYHKGRNTLLKKVDVSEGGVIVQGNIYDKQLEKYDMENVNYYSNED